MLKRFDRYVFTEVLGPLALGLLVFTFILLMDVLFSAAEIIIRRNVSPWMVGELLLLNLPHIVVLTIPMAFLYGLLIAVGRMASDSELIAVRASGVSLFTLYRPLLILSSLLTVGTMFLMLYVMPWGNHRREELLHELAASGIAAAVKPRVFYEEIDDKILYVFDASVDGQTWNGVFLSDALPRAENSVTIARAGELRMGARGDSPVLVLQQSLDQQVDLQDPEDIHTSMHRQVEVRLIERDVGQQGTRSKGLREMYLYELRDEIDDPEVAETRRNLARVEFHKRFAIPMSCLVLGLFGLPLGFGNRRGGRSSGFAISTLVIMIFFVLLNNGEDAAANGRLEPWIAMWGPNLLFAAAGAFLLARRNLDKSLLLSQVDRWVRHHIQPRLIVRQRLRQRRRFRRVQQRRRSTRGGNGLNGKGQRADFVIRVPRLRLRFPNLFDRYVMKLFARVFLLVVAAVTAVYLIGDFTGLVGDVMKNDIGWGTVFQYYQYKSLLIFYQTAPVVVLLTTLTTFALLSHSNEVTAAKALGLSLYRLAIPAIVTALLVAGLSAFLDNSVLPHTNARVAELNDEIRGRQGARSYRRADQQWLAGRGRDGSEYIYNYQYYDPRRRALQRLQVFRFDQNHALTGRLYADTAVHEESGWWMTGGWSRTFDGVEVTHYQDLSDTVLLDLPEEPEFFDSEIKRPEQMNRAELQRYVDTLRAAGEEVPDLEVQLHNKVAMPIVCLVMAFIALPFAFRLGRRGALYGIGVALVLGIAFYGVIAFFTTLGETAALPPLVAVWSPNVLFATLSLYLFLGVRT